MATLSKTNTDSLIVIDSRVTDWQSLIVGIDPNATILILDAARDGLTQIAEAVANATNIAAIHLISHGSAGSLQLGSSTLDSSNLSAYQAQLAMIGNALSVDGDILLYGCNVAQGSIGQQFIDQLGLLTGADIAASTDLTGAANQGGDWVLEASTGAIETQTLSSETWQSVLSAGSLTWNSSLTLADSTNLTTNYGLEFYGNFLYVTDYSGNNIDIYAVDSTTGALSYSASSGAFGTGANQFYNPVDLAFYSAGGTTHAYVSDGANHRIAVMDVNLATGALTWNSSLTLADTSHLTTNYGLEFYGNFLYATDYSGNNIDIYAVNSSTGALSYSASVGTIGTGVNQFNNPLDLAFYNAGGTTHAYIADYGNHRIAVMDVNVATGALTWNSSLTLADSAHLTGSLGLEIHGNYLYLTDYNGNNIDIYTVDSSTGALSYSSSVGSGGAGVNQFNNALDLAFYSAGGSTRAYIADGGNKRIVVMDVGNVAPTVIAGTTTAFTEQTPVAVSNTIIINDPNGDTDWNAGTLRVQITANNTAADGLALATSNNGGIWLSGTTLMSNTTVIGNANTTAVSNGTAWTFSFNAAATSTLVQATARAIQFTNSSDTPDTTNRTITFTATDNSTGVSSATQTVSIIPVNDAPTSVNNTGLSIAEDAPGTAISSAMLQATDFEQTAATLTYTIINAAAKGSLSKGGVSLTAGSTFTQADINAGLILFTPSANANGSDSFSFSVADGVGGVLSSQTFNISISAVNDAPTFTGGTNAGLIIAEDALVTTITAAMLQVIDFEQTASALTYTLGSTTTHGILTKSGTALIAGNTFTQADINAGLIQFTPSLNFNGSDGFSFSVADGVGGLLNSQTFSINITAVNDTPTFIGGTNIGLTVIEDAPLTTITSAMLQVTDLEQTASALTYTLASTTTHGTLTRGGTVLAEGSTFTQADINAGLIQFAPSQNANGSDGFSFSVADGAGGLLIGQSFNIAITAINDAPTSAINTGLTVLEDASITTITAAILQVTDLEQAASALTYTLSSAPTRGTLTKSGTALVAGNTFTQADINAGLIKFTPSANANGSDSFNFSVADGAGGVLSGQIFNIGINAVNDAPTFLGLGGTNTGLTVVEDASITTISPSMLQVTDLEQAASALTYTLSTIPTRGTLTKSGTVLLAGHSFTQADINAGLIQFTPSFNANGSDSFNFSVSDGAGGLLIDQAFNIAITAVNDAPTSVSNTGLTVLEDAAITTITAAMLQVADLEQTASALTYTLGSTPIHGTLTKGGTVLVAGNTFTQADINTGLIQFTPSLNVNGIDGFNFSVADGAGGLLIAQSFNISITAVNDAPVSTNNTGLTVLEDAALTPISSAMLQVTDIEQAASALTYTLASTTASGTLTKSGTALVAGNTFTQADIDAGLIAFTPNANANGSDSFSFSVTDGAGGTLFSQSFSISITAVNDAPISTNNTGLTVLEDATTTTITTAMLQITDAEQTAAALTYRLASTTAHGSLTKGGIALAAGDVFTQADIDAGLIAFTPTANANGSDGFSFSVSDGILGGTLNGQSFSINISAVNDAPTSTINTGLTVLEDAPFTTITAAMLQVTDLEQSAAALTYTLASSTANGTLTKSGTALGAGGTFTQADINAGLIAFTPSLNANGNDSFNFSVADGAGGLLSGQSFSINITPVNDAPTFTNGVNTGLTVLEDAATTTITTAMLQVTDIEQAASALTYTLSSTATRGTLTKSGTVLAIGDTFTQADINAGLIAFTPTANINGSDSFSFSVADGAGGSLLGQTFSININAVNDAPTSFVNTGLIILEDAPITPITTAMLQVTDLEQTASALTYTLTSTTSNGTLTKNATVLAAGGTFTQADINAGLIAFTPSLNANGSDSFSFSVSDGVGGVLSGQSFSININAVNDAPISTTNTGLTILEDAATTTITTAMLRVTDVEQSASALTYTLASTTSSGTLAKSGTTLVTGDTFTQADIDAGLIAYTPTANANGSDNFSFSVSDGLLGGTLTGQAFNINITSVNDIPTLTTFSAAVGAGNEDTEITVNFAALQTQGNEADIDGTVTGFVIKAISTGTLKIGASAASATAWVAGSNDTVDATHQAYWTPALNTSGILNAFTAVAKDNSGSTSVGPVQATINITAVNDAPVLSTPATANYTDTAFVDTFTTITGTLASSDVDSTGLTYGILDGTDHGDGTVSLSNAYGTLTVTKTTGAYSFVPNSTAIEPLSANVTNSLLMVTVSDGLLTDSKAFNVTISQNGATESNGNDTLVGTVGNDTFNALAGNDIIDGLAGADDMTGGTGNDVYYVDNAGDVVTENAGEGTDTVYASITYTLNDDVENLILTGSTAINGTGNSLNNQLTGNTANNVLSGGLGADTLIGWLGNDLYIVDNTGDVITEYAAQGSDTVNSSISYTLANNVENLILTGTTAINGTGNTLDNQLTGNTGNNLLNGGLGADTLIGGIGDDTYIIDDTGDLITENAAQGSDTVNSSITYTLTTNVENLILTGTATINGIGNEINNLIVGNTGNNTLNGGLGADSMTGATGNDLYIIDNAGDSVTEYASQGTDTVYSSIAYTLTANVENLTLTGSATINGTGNGLNNQLIGNSANNILKGELGADAMIGGTGDDAYFIDNTGDTITEYLNQGSDTVYSSITHTLISNVENLILTGSATINGTGNSLNNQLTGNAANNVLNGGLGGDSLIGSIGDDTYIVDNAADLITEYVGQGLDTVQSSVAYTLTANVEDLTLIGASTVNGTGNALNNQLTGNTANNVLNGGDGSDTLIGGTGKDNYILTETVAASDTVRIAAGDSLISGYDLVNGFRLSTSTVSTTGVDKLDLATTAIAANAAAVNGVDAGIIRSHHINNGIISFDDVNTYTTPLTIISADLPDVFNYLQANITGGNTVAFVSQGNTYVFQDGGVNDTLVELVGVGASSLNNTGLVAGAAWIV